MALQASDIAHSDEGIKNIDQEQLLVIISEAANILDFQKWKVATRWMTHHEPGTEIE